MAGSADGLAGDAPSLVGSLTKLFDRALRELGRAGQTDLACRLAADGWALLRHDHPREAERLNGVLHYLTRAVPEPGRPARGGEPHGDE